MRKKIIALACATVLAMAALTGCFSSGGSTGGSTGGTETDATAADLVGTWVMEAAYDYEGNEYDLSSLTDTVTLEVTSATQATLYYFDDEAFEGTLSRDASRDSAYSADGFTVMVYDLTGADGSYWEFCYVVEDDDPTVCFVYLEVGADQPDGLYLGKQ